jgi:hypothetical protein
VRSDGIRTLLDWQARSFAVLLTVEPGCQPPGAT